MTFIVCSKWIDEDFVVNKVSERDLSVQEKIYTLKENFDNRLKDFFKEAGEPLQILELDNKAGEKYLPSRFKMRFTVESFYYCKLNCFDTVYIALIKISI